MLSLPRSLRSRLLGRLAEADSPHALESALLPEALKKPTTGELVKRSFPVVFSATKLPMPFADGRAFVHYTLVRNDQGASVKPDLARLGLGVPGAFVQGGHLAVVE